MSLETTGQQLKLLSKAISDATVALEQGGSVDLNYLEGRVQYVCNGIIRSLPGSRSIAIIQSINAIVHSLDDLSNALTGQFQRTITKEGLRNVVYSAYGKSALTGDEI